MKRQTSPVRNATSPGSSPAADAATGKDRGPRTTAAKSAPRAAATASARPSGKSADKVGGSDVMKAPAKRVAPKSAPAAQAVPAQTAVRAASGLSPASGVSATGGARAGALTPSLSPAEREERIRRLAYTYFESRDGAAGSALDDWLRAEAEVSAEIARALARWAGD